MTEERRDLPWWKFFALEGILLLLLVASYFVGLWLGAQQYLGVGGSY